MGKHLPLGSLESTGLLKWLCGLKHTADLVSPVDK